MKVPDAMPLTGANRDQKEISVSSVAFCSILFYEEAKRDGWMVIGMKNDWKKIFAFEQ